MACHPARDLMFWITFSCYHADFSSSFVELTVIAICVFYLNVADYRIKIDQLHLSFASEFKKKVQEMAYQLKKSED